MVAVDQITKSIAVARLDRGDSVEVIGSLLTFDLTTNSGGSFSLFQGSTPILAVLAIGATGYLIHLLRTTDDRLTVAGLTLLLCGALGNLSDRFFRSPGFLRGEVVDFIRLPNWPTFNVADMAVTFGSIALIASVLFGGRAASRATAESAAGDATNPGEPDDDRAVEPGPPTSPPTSPPTADERSTSDESAPPR